MVTSSKRPHTQLSFDLAIADGETPAQRDRQFIWNGTFRNSVSSAVWGRMRLAQ